VRGEGIADAMQSLNCIHLPMGDGEKCKQAAKLYCIPVPERR